MSWGNETGKMSLKPRKSLGLNDNPRPRPGRKDADPIDPEWEFTLTSLHELLNMLFESKPTSAQQHCLLSQGTVLNIMENKVVGVYSKEVMT